MPWWMNAIGAMVGGLATFIISWSALRPRQRVFATRLAARLSYRIAVFFAVCYFGWINVNFVLKTEPVGRLELWLLVIANAEALIILLVSLFTTFFGVYLDKQRQLRMQLVNRIAMLESPVGKIEEASAAIPTPLIEPAP